MRYSQAFIYTLRETPSEAEVPSHRLMLRTGMIQKVAAGIYSYLPLGWRSIRKLETIIRQEMDAKGAVELSMPAVQPAEIWQESGRWYEYGKELLRFKDRHDRDFCFGPTHEEVITTIVRSFIRSYRQLPLNLYQIQTKFRDEIRPRFGLMRGREFIMKDAYSFHATADSLDETYEKMREAYCRIFERCGLAYTMVEADTGPIGGSLSHEFMVLAQTGEDVVFQCQNCGYGANAEKATPGPLPYPEEGEKEKPLEKVHTPDMKTVEEVAAFLGVAPFKLIKTLLYETDKGYVAVLIRGDREVQEVKLKNFLSAQYVTLAGEDKIQEITGGPLGFSGPCGLKGIKILADHSLKGLTNGVTGANEKDYHYRHVNYPRDFTVDQWVDVALAQDGDPCPQCGQPLRLYRGIEVGHIFKLGTKYSKPMGCNFLDEKGQEVPMMMGCYGLGVGRTIAAAIEQSHDEKGIIWPKALAPYEVIILGLNPDDPQVVRASEALYGKLMDIGVEVLWDDRNERGGVKFHDADLLGMPLQIIVGSRGIAKKRVEIKIRKSHEKMEVPYDESVDKALGLLHTL